MEAERPEAALRSSAAPGPVPEGKGPRARSGLARILRRILAPDCIVCGIASGDPACAGCLRDYFAHDRPRCRICANRLPPIACEDPNRRSQREVCGHCLVRPPAFDATVALSDYLPPVDGMVAALKFHGRLDLGRAFGCLLAQRLRGLEFDAAIPIPLGPGRLRERGYNQSEEIARSCCAQLRRPMLPDALVRVREGPAQQSLGLAQRRTNVRGAFCARRRFDAHALLLVDDVLTSGSTLDEAAACLRQAGARTVVCAVVARTP